MTVQAAIAATRDDGRQRTVRCPAHQDKQASLSVGRGDDAAVLMKCHAGCSTEAVLSASGLRWSDLKPRSTDDDEADRRPHRQIAATYKYHDEHGNHLFDVVRFVPKDFRQRRADGAWTMQGVRRVLYRLPHLVGHGTVFITEGEKDADTLATLGLPATCNPGGAGKWRPEYGAMLRAAGAAAVVVVPDCDDVGRRHADEVARQCHAAGLTVRVLTLPDLPEKADVSDWLAQQGHTVDALRVLVDACPVYRPPAELSSRPADQSRLDLCTLSDLFADPDDITPWLVEDRFARASVNLLAGKPKAGKSTLARALALAVARGDWWLGSRCQQGAVVYLALEDKKSEIRRHLRAMGATGSEPLRLLIGQAPQTLLSDLDAVIASGDRVDLVIVDTAQRLLRVADANDYTKVTDAFEPVLQLARTRGTCIVLLHHAAKVDRVGLDGLLGSTAWAGSADNVMILGRTERYRVLQSTQRIGPDLPETVVEMDEATGAVRLAGTRSLHDQQGVADVMARVRADAGPDGLLRADLLEAVEGRCSITSRTARSRTSGENRRGRPRYPTVPRNEVSENPGMFSWSRRGCRRMWRGAW